MGMGPKEAAQRAQARARYEEGRLKAGAVPKPVTPRIQTRNATPVVPKPVTAEKCVCGNPLRKPVRGPPPEFCSPACKQKAYRQRKAGA